MAKDAPDDDGDDDNIVVKVKVIDPDQPVLKTVTVTLRLTTGFEDATVKLAVQPASFTVKQVQSLSVDQAVQVYAAQVKAAAKAANSLKVAGELPATGSESSGAATLALWLVMLGSGVHLGGWALARRRRTNR